jgi:sensor histidine kinase regulating citrate/malate metabolism
MAVALANQRGPRPFTTKDVGKGTGLGLVSVKAFATQVGGDVLVTSEPGRGFSAQQLLDEVHRLVDAKQPGHE